MKNDDNDDDDDVGRWQSRRRWSTSINDGNWFLHKKSNIKWCEWRWDRETQRDYFFKYIFFFKKAHQAGTKDNLA